MTVALEDLTICSARDHWPLTNHRRLYGCYTRGRRFRHFLHRHHGQLLCSQDRDLRSSNDFRRWIHGTSNLISNYRRSNKTKKIYRVYVVWGKDKRILIPGLIWMLGSICKCWFLLRATPFNKLLNSSCILWSDITNQTQECFVNLHHDD